MFPVVSTATASRLLIAMLFPSATAVSVLVFPETVVRTMSPAVEVIAGCVSVPEANVEPVIVISAPAVMSFVKVLPLSTIVVPAVIVP